jgi:hypothetical protein
MENRFNSTDLDQHELSDEDLSKISAGNLWDAFICFLHGGTDASHTQSRREGGGPRGG